MPISRSTAKPNNPLNWSRCRCRGQTQTLRTKHKIDILYHLADLLLRLSLHRTKGFVALHFKMVAGRRLSGETSRRPHSRGQAGRGQVLTVLVASKNAFLFSLYCCFMKTSKSGQWSAVDVAITHAPHPTPPTPCTPLVECHVAHAAEK